MIKLYKSLLLSATIAVSGQALASSLAPTPQAGQVKISVPKISVNGSFNVKLKTSLPRAVLKHAQIELYRSHDNGHFTLISAIPNFTAISQNIPEPGNYVYKAVVRYSNNGEERVYSSDDSAAVDVKINNYSLLKLSQKTAKARKSNVASY